MDISEILNAPEDKPLDLYEQIMLVQSRYVFNASTPTRLKKSAYAIEQSLMNNFKSVDFSDPVILETLKNTVDKKSLRNIMGSIGYNKASELDLPYTDIYKETIPYSNNTKVFTIKALISKVKENGIEAVWGSEFVESFRYITLMFENMDSKSKQAIIDTILQEDFPVQLIPTQILTDDYFLAAFMKYHNMDKNLMAAVYASLKGDEYKSNYETALASATGYSSLEEYIQHEIVLNEKDDPISKITQIAAIRLNTMKQLKEHGIENIEVIVNEYCVDQQLGHSGGCGEDQIHIYTFPNTTSKERYRTSLHEERHAQQDKAVAEGDITTFPDADVYSKEKLLREALNYAYYLYNYFSLGIEYDADFASEKHVQELEKGRAKDGDVDKAIRYKKTYIRKDLDGNAMHIDDLFEIVANREMASTKSEDVKEFLLEEYPILYHQYNVDEEHGFRKKTPSELIQGLYGEHKDTYIGLIKSSITPDKDKHSLRNIQEYERILMEEELDEALREELSSIVQEYKQRHTEVSKNV